MNGVVSPANTVQRSVAEIVDPQRLPDLPG
jgi:hypothetical protein